VVAAVAAVGWAVGRADGSATADPGAPGPIAFAARVDAVVDGDTVRVTTPRDRETVRLLGVNTPETHHPTKGRECFGREASAFTRRELSGRSVRLELDVEHRDQYGRLLAYVIVDGRRFNDELLRRGYARVLIIPPNGIHGRAMVEAELAAKREGRGLWSACPG
jgi:micrococcal nuclease